MGTKGSSRSASASAVQRHTATQVPLRHLRFSLGLVAGHYKRQGQRAKKRRSRSARLRPSSRGSMYILGIRTCDRPAVRIPYVPLWVPGRYLALSCSRQNTLGALSLIFFPAYIKSSSASLLPRPANFFTTYLRCSCKQRDSIDTSLAASCVNSAIILPALPGSASTSIPGRLKRTQRASPNVAAARQKLALQVRRRNKGTGELSKPRSTCPVRVVEARAREIATKLRRPGGSSKDSKTYILFMPLLKILPLPASRLFEFIFAVDQLAS